MDGGLDKNSSHKDAKESVDYFFFIKKKVVFLTLNIAAAR
jgi:hypothetical protein